MQRTLFCIALTAATLMMYAAYAQTLAGALPQLAPGESLGLALGMPTVPNQYRSAHTLLARSWTGKHFSGAPIERHQECVSYAS
jgi:hypothetical protein